MQKLPTLLEGEALEVWLDLMEETQRDYAEDKKAIEKALVSKGPCFLRRFSSTEAPSWQGYITLCT